MKTKTLLYILMSVLVLSFASCNDDDKINYLKHDELPKEVQTFLNEYLPNNEMISARINMFDGGFQYIVQLEEVEALFYSNGVWYKLISEKGLPKTTRTLLSENSRKELSEKHPAAKVLIMTNRLDMEVTIDLDDSKTYCDISGHEGKTLAEEWVWDNDIMKILPEKMKEFVNKVIVTNIQTTDFEPWYQVFKFSGFKGTIYRFRITPYTFVDFYEDGEWFYMKEARTHEIIKNTLIKAIPAEVIATLKKEEPNALASIQKITRFNNNELYGFTLAEKNFVLVNSDNQIVEPPLVKAKEFIKKGFGLEDGLEYKVNSNTTIPYFLRYGFIVTGKIGEMDKILLVTDVEGNMRSVSAGPITTDQQKTIALPRAVIETLHKDIVSYFDTKYPEGKAIRIYHSYSKVGDMPSEVNLTMSIPNNMQTLVFNCNTGEFIKEYFTLGN